MGASRNYRSGDCEKLAESIHILTGWRFIIITGAGAHVAVIPEDTEDVLLDVDGIRPIDDVANTWGGGVPADVTTTDDLYEEGWSSGIFQIDLLAARDVLRAAGLWTDELETILGDWIEDYDIDEFECLSR